tara:strand:+ start:237 stop:395 length:159 start_codon:yes stop_codon:yes gene_type:complete
MTPKKKRKWAAVEEAKKEAAEKAKKEIVSEPVKQEEPAAPVTKRKTRKGKKA